MTFQKIYVRNPINSAFLQRTFATLILWIPSIHANITLLALNVVPQK